MAYDAFTPRTTETRLTSPLNGSIYTTTRQVPLGMVLPAVGDTMESQLGAAWATSRIVSIATVPQNGKMALTLVHARIPSETAQLASNWETSTADIGGQKYPSVQRTFILLASDYAEHSPAAGSAMPVVAGDQFDGMGYILTDRSVKKSGMQFEPVFKVETQNYVRKSVITNVGVDPLNGKTLTTTSELRYAGEVVTGGLTMAQLAVLPDHAYWGIQSNGTQRTFQQLSASWYTVVTEQIVGGEFVDGAVMVGSYYTNDNYSWPPVLESLGMMEWQLRAGGEHKLCNFTFRPEGYSGPCRTLVERYWSVGPFDITQVPQMLPIRITYHCPDFRIMIPECLHPAVSLNDDKGNKDQTWKWTVGTERFFPATNYTTWPAQIVSFDDQESMRGGYLRTRRTTYSPAFTASVIPGKTEAVIALSDLVQTYTGSGISVTATTWPMDFAHPDTPRDLIGVGSSLGLPVTILYNWGTAAPVAAGTYDVMSFIDSPIYNGTFAATLTITKATAGVVLSGLTPTYDGSPHAATATTTTPSGLTVDVTYNGSSTAPTAAGSYAVVATINDPNHQGTAGATLTIAKAAAAVTITGTSQTHTGSPLSVTVTTLPAGLACSVLYDGDAAEPSDIGDYAVTATIVDANYSGSATPTTFHIT